MLGKINKVRQTGIIPASLVRFTGYQIRVLLGDPKGEVISDTEIEAMALADLARLIGPTAKGLVIKQQKNKSKEIECN